MSNAKGYKFVKAPEDYPGHIYSCGSRILEHHLVWWLHTGKTVPVGYAVHHKNKDPTDNRFENLELITHGEHAKRHNPKKPDVLLQCSWCLKPLLRLGRDVDFKRSQGQENFFCCASHAGLFGGTKARRKRVIEHGTYGRYRKGCRCSACKAANTARHRKYRENKQKDMGR